MLLSDEFAQTLVDSGLPRLPARVFSALLYDADGSMTAAELRDVLGVSPGGVSGAVRYLETTNLLRRERAPGTRHDVYVVRDDAWIDALLQHDRTYAPMITTLGSALERLAADDPARIRIDNSREFLLWLGDELDALADRWQEHQRGRGR